MLMLAGFRKSKPEVRTDQDSPRGDKATKRRLILLSFVFLLLGCSSLLGSLRGGQLAAGEDKNAEPGESSAQQQHNLANCQPELLPGNAATGAERIDRRKLLRQSDYLENGFE